MRGGDTDSHDQDCYSHRDARSLDRAVSEGEAFWHAKGFGGRARGADASTECRPYGTGGADTTWNVSLTSWCAWRLDVTEASLSTVMTRIVAKSRARSVGPTRDRAIAALTDGRIRIERSSCNLWSGDTECLPHPSPDRRRWCRSLAFIFCTIETTIPSPTH